MPEKYGTDQENFWAGVFGTDYITRNQGPDAEAGRSHMLTLALANTENLSSAVEFGPNLGLNLCALRRLFPSIELAGIEINPAAVKELEALGDVCVHRGSILQSQVSRAYDLAFTVGVLIHVNPDSLVKVYDNLHAASARYVLVAEYYNPSPMEISYRGFDQRLFKRDFAGEMLDRFDDLTLVDYGFCYRRDNKFPLDDITWFLMEKS
tara:strand:- start:247 stop:870 length:624 start_codon:yes stop_codon:yes gene_type:complete